MVSTPGVLRVTVVDRSPISSRSQGPLSPGRRMFTSHGGDPGLPSLRCGGLSIRLPANGGRGIHRNKRQRETLAASHRVGQIEWRYQSVVGIALHDDADAPLRGHVFRAGKHESRGDQKQPVMFGHGTIVPPHQTRGLSHARAADDEHKSYQGEGSRGTMTRGMRTPSGVPGAATVQRHKGLPDWPQLRTHARGPGAVSLSQTVVVEVPPPAPSRPRRTPWSRSFGDQPSPRSRT